MAIVPPEEPRITDIWGNDVDLNYPPIPNDTITDAIYKLINQIDKLENRIKQLETAYMEEKLLGKAGDSGTIESCLTQNKS